MLLTGLCLLLATSTLHGMGPVKATPRIGPDACWSPDTTIMEKIRGACAPLSGDGFEACFVAGMQKSGASPQAVAFSQSIGNLGYMEALRQSGQVDIAFVVYPFRANENQGFLLVNGDPPLVDVDDLSLLSPDPLKEDLRYIRLKRLYPAVALWPGDRSDRDYPMPERTPDGGLRFMVRYRLLNGCHACELAGHALYAFEFDKTGRFLGTTYLCVEKPSEISEFSELPDSDPAAPIAVAPGQTFTLTLRSNPTTGYIWQVAEPVDERILHLIGSEYLSDKTGLTGAGGREVWTFKAVGTGETRITLKYARSWETNAAPAKTARFTVMSGGKMKMQGVKP
jgi:predicted secreted protein